MLPKGGVNTIPLRFLYGGGGGIGVAAGPSAFFRVCLHESAREKESDREGEGGREGGREGERERERESTRGHACVCVCVCACARACVVRASYFYMCVCVVCDFVLGFSQTGTPEIPAEAARRGFGAGSCGTGNPSTRVTNDTITASDTPLSMLLTDIPNRVHYTLSRNWCALRCYESCRCPWRYLLYKRTHLSYTSL
jgi:hypothetical protein